jgi:hypothetical protein
VGEAGRRGAGERALSLRPGVGPRPLPAPARAAPLPPPHLTRGRRPPEKTRHAWRRLAGIVAARGRQAAAAAAGRGPRARAWCAARRCSARSAAHDAAAAGSRRGPGAAPPRSESCWRPSLAGAARGARRGAQGGDLGPRFWWGWGVVRRGRGQNEACTGSFAFRWRRAPDQRRAPPAPPARRRAALSPAAGGSGARACLDAGDPQLPLPPPPAVDGAAAVGVALGHLGGGNMEQRRGRFAIGGAPRGAPQVGGAGAQVQAPRCPKPRRPVPRLSFGCARRSTLYNSCRQRAPLATVYRTAGCGAGAGAGAAAARRRLPPLPLRLRRRPRPARHQAAALTHQVHPHTHPWRRSRMRTAP